MATRNDIHISGTYVVHHKFYAFSICTLYLEKLKGRTESYFIPVLFLKLNDHPPWSSNFGLRRLHPNGCKFELNKTKSKSKTKPF